MDGIQKYSEMEFFCDTFEYKNLVWVKRYQKMNINNILDIISINENQITQVYCISTDWILDVLGKLK